MAQQEGIGVKACGSLHTGIGTSGLSDFGF